MRGIFFCEVHSYHDVTAVLGMLLKNKSQNTDDNILLPSIFVLRPVISTVSWESFYIDWSGESPLCFQSKPYGDSLDICFCFQNYFQFNKITLLAWAMHRWQKCKRLWIPHSLPFCFFKMYISHLFVFFIRNPYSSLNHVNGPAKGRMGSTTLLASFEGGIVWLEVVFWVLQIFFCKLYLDQFP